MDEGNKITKTASWYTLLMAISKIVIGVATASIAVLTDGLHSLVDAGGAIFAQYAYHFSRTSPDREHPYGHGKMEGIAGFVEIMLIYATSIFIIYEGIIRFFHPDLVISLLPAAIAVMFISMIGNFAIAHFMKKTSEQTNSMTLKTEAIHLMVDFYTSAGILIAIIIIYFTKIKQIDSISSILVISAVLAFTVKPLINSLDILMDKKVSDGVEERIREVLTSYNNRFIEFHNLRTRNNGISISVDMHIVVHKGTTIEEAHKICDDIEKALSAEYPGIDVLIHVEPCEDSCPI